MVWRDLATGTPDRLLCVVMTQWNQELVAGIAGEIRRCRNAKKLSAAKLSDRTAAVGMKITRAVIADLENGRKKTLDISELIVLARALEVPPLQLIYPDLPDGEVEMWPGVENRSIVAAQWFSGEIRLMEDDEGHFFYIPKSHQDVPDNRISRAREIADSEDHLRVNLARQELTSRRSTEFEREQYERDLRQEDYLVDDLATEIERATRMGDAVNLGRLPVRVQEAVRKRLGEDPDDRARRVAAEIRGEMRDGR